MPIRINLKELFPSDAQDLTVDKINFNFNKLLELGIGDQGLRGFSGIAGAAGPGGNPGPAGERGNFWHLDAAPDPNTLTFVDLQEGDIYLDTINFSVWQYDGSVWNFQFDLSSIVNNYLAASPSPFVRGLGVGSPKDDRFILFNRRGDSTDQTIGAVIPNSANNDVLFLNNFNESELAYQPIPELVVGNTGDDFNALLKIFTENIYSATEVGRYHLEMGVLYEDTSMPAPYDNKLTSIHENLKVYFTRESSPAIPYLDYFTKSIFSMDAVAGFDSLRQTNGIFEFRFPRLDGSVKEAVSTYIGSQYGMDQVLNVDGISSVDGILFSENISNLRASIGLAQKYNLVNSNSSALILAESGYVSNVLDSQSYFMLDNLGTGLSGIYINEKLLQDGGNIVQVGTTLPRIPTVHTSSNGSPGSFSSYIGHMGIASVGNQIYTVSGNFNFTTSASDLVNLYGYVNKFVIENPNNPVQVFTGYSKHNNRLQQGAPPAICAPAGYTGSNPPLGIALSDIDIVGEYAYVVNSHIIDASASNSGSGVNSYRRSFFQIWKLNSVADIAPLRISYLGYLEKGGSLSSGNDPEELNGAYRLKVKGKHAIVATNALYTNAGTSFLGNGTSFSAGNEYAGRLTAVDISNPQDPLIVASVSPTSNVSFGVKRSAIIDFEIIDDYAVALTWEQGIDNSTPVPVNVRMDVFDISGLDINSTVPSIRWSGRSTSSLFSSASVDSSAWNDLSKRGAITANKKYIYAGWGEKVTVYAFDRRTSSGTFGSCFDSYPTIGQITLPITANPSGGEYGIYDMKQLGNSLYILAIDSTDSISYVFKYDISAGLTDSSTLDFTNALIWQKPLISNPATANEGYGARMKIIGKHIYVATHNNTNSDTDAVSLIPLDFDGIYTGGAHIESLRADQAQVLGDLEVGQTLNVANDAMVGGSSYVENNLTVGGEIRGIGAMPIGSVIPFAGSSTPTGWRLCNGASVSSTTYLALHKVISNTYGGSAYTGATGLNFDLPNLKTRIPIGYDSATAPFNVLGDIGDIDLSTGLGEYIVLNYIIYTGIG